MRNRKIIPVGRFGCPRGKGYNVIGYGWTEQHLHAACAYANTVIVPEGGVPITLNNLEVKTRKCKLGNSTLSFSLSFTGSTARRKDGTYPAGTAYTTTMMSKLLPRQPIPTAEVQNIRKNGGNYPEGREYTMVAVTRSTGSLCWHTFGHFMAKLFDLNPGGRLVTGANNYENRDDFWGKADYNLKQGRHDCTCHQQGIGNFMQIRLDA